MSYDEDLAKKLVPSVDVESMLGETWKKAQTLCPIFIIDDGTGGTVAWHSEFANGGPYVTFDEETAKKVAAQMEQSYRVEHVAAVHLLKTFSSFQVLFESQDIEGGFIGNMFHKNNQSDR